MSQSGAAIKVGAVVVATALLLAGVTWFFLGRSMGGYPVNVTFKDAQGTKEGADVRLSGVKIGVVRSVDVDDTGRRVLFHLTIFKDRRIPEGAVYTLTSGGLLGEMYVQVTPNPTAETGRSLPTSGKPVPSVVGTELPSFDDLRLKVADLGNGANDVVSNMRRISARLATMAEDPYFEKRMKGTADNVEIASLKAAAAAARVDSMLAQEMPAIRRMMAEIEAGTQTLGPIGRTANSAAGNAAQVAANVNRLVKNLNESVAFLDGTLRDTLAEAEIGPNLKATLSNIKEASSNFAAVTADARKITHDLANKGEADSKVGETVTAVMKASEKASALLDKISGVADKAGKTHTPKIRVYQQAEATQGFGPDGRFQADVNAYFPRSGGEALLVGLADIGEGNKLNLQNVSAVSQHLHLRYGLHSSRLGAGLEYSRLDRLPPPGQPLSPGTRSLSADLYSPNDLQFDMYFRQQLNHNLGLGVGFQDLLHKGHPGISLTYRQ